MEIKNSSEKKQFLTRSIWIISLVSLFTDISSEMLYPVMPIYLKSIGFSALLIGILEGFAEATAGLSKGYFGKLSDLTGRRLPFVQLGYFLSSLAKPMLAVFSYSWWVFTARFLDRLGKGVRTGARDALLSEESTRENKGKVFGFHRGMDTLGAAIGPFFALLYLSYYPGNYRVLFLIAFIPAIFGVFLTMLIPEKRKTVISSEENEKPVKPVRNFFAFLSYWKMASRSYRKLVLGLFGFTLFNSSDVFLLLMAKNQGISDKNIIGVYIFYNLVYAFASYPMGILADKISMKFSFITGLLLFVIVYTGMAFQPDIRLLFALFFLYGLYAASTDGVSKAWISSITPDPEIGTAIGFYTGLSSILIMLASSLAGLIWVLFNPSLTFIISAAGVFLITLYFYFGKFDKNE
jgi:MFS family permease